MRSGESSVLLAAVFCYSQAAWPQHCDTSKHKVHTPHCSAVRFVVCWMQSR